MSLVCELKYCECCGALMVRHGGSTGSYCKPCEQLLQHATLPVEALRAILRTRRSQTPPSAGPTVAVLSSAHFLQERPR